MSTQILIFALPIPRILRYFENCNYNKEGLNTNIEFPTTAIKPFLFVGRDCFDSRMQGKGLGSTIASGLLGVCSQKQK